MILGTIIRLTKSGSSEFLCNRDSEDPAPCFVFFFSFSFSYPNVNKSLALPIIGFMGRIEYDSG